MICHGPREGLHHNAIISPCLHKYFQNDNAAAEHCVPPPEQMCTEKRGRTGKKAWHKSKARAKRLIIFQQKQVRMVGLHLYTLPFVRSTHYCPSINGDIKKLWQIPQVSYHWERDQPKQAEQGWAFQPEALEDFTVFMWQRFGLSLHRASTQSQNAETGYCHS